MKDREQRSQKDAVNWTRVAAVAVVLTSASYLWVIQAGITKSNESDGRGDTASRPLVAHETHYLGHLCTDDCSGHKAGARWAQERELDDPGDCVGNSPSFISGCRAYVEAGRGERGHPSDQ